MDPLSVTSGIVGIVAFALQLAKTAAKVKKAVEEVKSAPKEARELIERLVMLETTCELIGFHLERRETLPGGSSSTSPDIMSKALAQCLVRIQDLEQMVASSSPADSGSGTPRLKFDTASRLRLVLRKEKINSLVQEIDRVVSLLQFVIQVDMWTMTSGPPQSHLLSNNGIYQIDQPHKPERTSNLMLVHVRSSQSNVARNIRRPTTKQCHTFRYLGYITWTVTDGWIGDDDDDVNRIAHKKASISFRLPFTSTQLGIHYDGGMGTPSYALNVSHVIEENSELGRRLRSVIGGDPEQLHRMISKRELSLYSLFRTWGGDMNLFFMAVSSRWAEGCKYLLQHDFRNRFAQDETPRYMWGSMYSLPGNTCEVTETILSVRPYDMQEKDFKFLLNTGSHPEYFSRYSKVFLESPAIDRHALLDYAWDRLVVSLVVYPDAFDDVFSWVPAFQYLIDQGVDIHQLIIGDWSAYGQVLISTTHPFEADERACFWLKILKACGVDIQNYVEIESSIVEKHGCGNYANQRQRKMVILDYEGLPMLSWRWELPTGSNIIEVLREFHNLGSELMEYKLRGLHPSGPEDFKHWNADHHYAYWGKDCFPFLLAPIDCIKGLNDDRLDRLWCRETYIRAVEIRDKRLARRQVKKWRKAHPGEKPPSTIMPGTWVD